MYYTGIGSRQTPNIILKYMAKLAKILDEYSYILRSGGADGADSAFESGTMNKEIFLPWKGFNNNDSQLYDIKSESFEIAERFHPNWIKLSNGAKKLHARNVHQILGKNLDKPSYFVVCWTKDGKASGGTGQAIRIAKYYNIRIFNLFNKNQRLELTNYISNVTFFTECFKQ